MTRRSYYVRYPERRPLRQDARRLWRLLLATWVVLIVWAGLKIAGVW